MNLGSWRTKGFKLGSIEQSHEYAKLEAFCKHTFDRFMQKNWFDKDTHDTKLQMLSYLVNSCIAQDKYDESLVHASNMRLEMDRYDKLLYTNYLIVYYNSLVIAYGKTNIQRGLETLDEFEKINKKGLKNSYYEQYILLNRVILNHNTQRFDEAIRNITKVYINDYYQNSDDTFKLKVELAETILQYEAKDLASCSKRIKQIEKRYKALLASKVYLYERTQLAILAEMAKQPHYKLSKRLITKIRKLIPTSLVNPDQAIIVFAEWIAEKIEAG
jgi:tetratricopeptide (TPR) repeat protein